MAFILWTLFALKITFVSYSTVALGSQQILICKISIKKSNQQQKQGEQKSAMHTSW